MHRALTRDRTMTYYKTDSRKISFREYWNLSRGGSFLFAWLCKVLGIPLNLTAGIPGPLSFRENVAEESVIPSGILAKLNSGVLELSKLGFNQFWYYTLKNSLMAGAAFGVQALHPSKIATGKIVFASIGPRESLAFVFGSPMHDGTFLGTTNNRPQFNSPPGYIVLRRVGANAAELWKLHQDRLAELAAANPPKAVRNFDGVVELEDETARMIYADRVARGIWVEMTDSEVVALRARQSHLR